jgi:addiction module RelE/StbE family toxin
MLRRDLDTTRTQAVRLQDYVADVRTGGRRTHPGLPYVQAVSRLMQLRWTEAATEDMERIADYLIEQFPLHAPRIVNEIYEAATKRLSFPAMGRPGRAEDTRELILAPMPYLIIYTITSETIHIVRILHGAQRWP